ncbi:MAG: hypothetical protein WCH01_22480 [Methylococcaceae bacterium]
MNTGNMALQVNAVNAFESLQAFVQAAVNHADFSKRQYEFSVLAAISGFQGCEQFAKVALALESECREVRLHSPIADKLGADPFSLPIALHRQFQGLKENDYTDWLAWVLQVLCQEVADPIKLCERLFGGELNTEVFNDYEDPDIQRETSIQHDGKNRRTDLLVSFMEKGLLWHIEVKVTTAEAGNLDAHEDYVKILRDKYYSGFDERNIRHILLVTKSARKDYPVDGRVHSFAALPWAELCQRLRQIVLDTDMSILSASIAMLFCGLVEQQLLGIHKDSIAQLKHLS